MRRAVLILTAVAAMAGTADAAAPVRGGAFCWDFDLTGTDAADRLEGTAGAEHAAAYGGDDVLLLFGGNDCAMTGLGNDVIHLGPGDDQAAGGRAADHLFGGPGDDVLLPGLGPDHVHGGDGDDLIRDERGDDQYDVLEGGEGHDVIRAVNAAGDSVRCGPGYDVAIVDALDVTSECERVEVARRPRIVVRQLRTGARPAFSVRWVPADLSLPARIAVLTVRHPPDRARCMVRAWSTRGSSVRVRLAWRGRQRPCRGEYGLALTYVARHRARPRVACEQLRGAPRRGCPPSERLGVVSVTVG